MATYELCVNEETAGGGVIYDTLELGIVAGEAAITPVEREDIPMTVDEGVFFTVHERDGGTALKYDSRSSYSAPGHRTYASKRGIGAGRLDIPGGMCRRVALRAESRCAALLSRTQEFVGWPLGWRVMGIRIGTTSRARAMRARHL